MCLHHTILSYLLISHEFISPLLATWAGNGTCHNLLVKSSAEKVIVVEVADVSANAAKGRDMVEAKLKYEPLLAINKGAGDIYAAKLLNERERECEREGDLER